MYNGLKLRILHCIIVAFLCLAANVAKAQIVTANPLEWAALAEGNAAIGGQINSEIKGQTETAALQHTIAAEYTLMHDWQKKYNDYLKLATHYAGIRKTLTSHCGRHTFATIAINNGVPVEVVSRILGHTNIKTTQIYAKVLSESVRRGFDKLSGLL